MDILKSFDWQKIGLVVLVLFLTSTLFSKCENEKVQLANVKALNSESKNYKLKNGQLVLSKEVLVYTNKQLKDLVISKDATLKEITNKFSTVKTITKIVTETKLDIIRLTYKDTIPFKFERKGELVTKDYHLDYKSTQKGITIDYLSIPDSLTIVTGLKRKWLFGKNVETIDISHSNKFVNNGQVNYYEVKQNKKFYETTLFKVGIGIILGKVILK